MSLAFSGGPHLGQPPTEHGRGWWLCVVCMQPALLPPRHTPCPQGTRRTLLPTTGQLRSRTGLTRTAAPQTRPPSSEHPTHMQGIRLHSARAGSGRRRTVSMPHWQSRPKLSLRCMWWVPLHPPHKRILEGSQHTMPAPSCAGTCLDRSVYTLRCWPLPRCPPRRASAPGSLSRMSAPQGMRCSRRRWSGRLHCRMIHSRTAVLPMRPPSSERPARKARMLSRSSSAGTSHRCSSCTPSYQRSLTQCPGRTSSAVWPPLRTHAPPDTPRTLLALPDAGIAPPSSASTPHCPTRTRCPGRKLRSCP